ncbi:hypothetical protein GCM10015536_77510 [Streptomyces griseomycini]|nr:hypothetical protein GCM10015536_77510 [Streptomyces griseomycini]
MQEGVAGEEGGGSGWGVGGPALFGGLDGDARGSGDLLEFRKGCGDEGQVSGAGGVIGVSSRKDSVAEEVPAGRLEVPVQVGQARGRWGLIAASRRWAGACGWLVGMPLTKIGP